VVELTPKGMLTSDMGGGKGRTPESGLARPDEIHAASRASTQGIVEGEAVDAPSPHGRERERGKMAYRHVGCGPAWVSR
jgi:hypothetical protein